MLQEALETAQAQTETLTHGQREEQSSFLQKAGPAVRAAHEELKKVEILAKQLMEQARTKLVQAIVPKTGHGKIGTSRHGLTFVYRHREGGWAVQIRVPVDSNSLVYFSKLFSGGISDRIDLGMAMIFADG
jgi:hypothetical protein